MPKPKQIEIPGCEHPSIKSIEDAAETYVEARDKRMKLLEQEIASRAKLIETMQNHAGKLSQDSDGNRIYKYDEHVVILAEQVGVKVKSTKSDEEPEEE